MPAINHRNPLGPVGKDPRHGTRQAYKYWGCRCAKCRKAHAKERKEEIQRYEVATHGTSGYHRGCRCERCRIAVSARLREDKLSQDQWRAMHAPEGEIIQVKMDLLA